MGKTLLRARKLSAAAFAALLAVALFLAPLCGVSCAASKHCADAAESDCHDSVSITADKPQPGLVSSKPCDRGGLPLFVVSTTKNWRSALALSASLPRVLGEALSADEKNTPRAFVVDGLRPSIPRTITTILQI
jgi:hypothetical protein